MESAAIVTVSLLVGFGIGFAFARTASGGRGRRALRMLVTVLAVCVSLLAVVGFVGIVSPTGLMTLISQLPAGIQEVVFIDLFLRGGTGFWAFLVLAGLLWWLRTSV